MAQALATHPLKRVPAVGKPDGVGSAGVDRVLAVFGTVRPGEGRTALLLALCVFAILCGYYALKTAREGLILSGGMLGLRGDELKIYAGGVMAALFVVIVPVYSTIANRVGRLRLIDLSYRCPRRSSRPSTASPRRARPVARRGRETSRTPRAQQRPGTRRGRVPRDSGSAPRGPHAGYRARRADRQAPTTTRLFPSTTRRKAV